MVGGTSDAFVKSVPEANLHHASEVLQRHSAKRNRDFTDKLKRLMLARSLQHCEVIEKPIAALSAHKCK